MKEHVVVVGAQWGDEGKGKLIDVFANKASAVVRFGGGANAGHSIKKNGVEYALSLVPSGILSGSTGIIGPGVAIDPWTLKDEVEMLRNKGVDVNPYNLVISGEATIVLPSHKAIDKENDASAMIGTTKKGIGPAYEDKAGRRAVTVASMRDYNRVVNLVNRHNRLLDYDSYEPDKIYNDLNEIADFIESFMGNTGDLINNVDGTVLYEGAQGTMLDNTHGTYPYVTSSTTVAPQALVGSGNANAINESVRVVGVAKAYTTRVGAGPFPTEDETEDGGIRLQKNGGEYGTVTGRARRCGWFDIPQMLHAQTINGINELALMKIDAMDGMENVYVCVGYYDANNEYTSVWPETGGFEDVTPVYQVLPGWDNTAGVRNWDDLHENAKKFVEFIEANVAKVTAVSTGKDANDMIYR